MEQFYQSIGSKTKSIRIRNKGIYIYVAIAGIVKVVITRIKQIAATTSRASTIGIKE